MPTPLRNLITLVTLLLLVITGLLLLTRIQTESVKGGCVCSRKTGACNRAIVADNKLYCNGEAI